MQIRSSMIIFDLNNTVSSAYIKSIPCRENIINVCAFVLHPWVPHMWSPSGTTEAFNLELMSSDSAKPPLGVLILNCYTLQLVAHELGSNYCPHIPSSPPPTHQSNPHTLFDKPRIVSFCCLFNPRYCWLMLLFWVAKCYEHCPYDCTGSHTLYLIP